MKDVLEQIKLYFYFNKIDHTLFLGLIISIKSTTFCFRTLVRPGARVPLRPGRRLPLHPHHHKHLPTRPVVAAQSQTIGILYIYRDIIYIFSPSIPLRKWYLG